MAWRLKYTCMKPKLIALLAVAAFTFIGLPGCFGPKRAKTEVKEVHKLDWWAKNPNITIESFEVKIVESELNLFNHIAKISYTIKGKMKSNDGWEPKISSVHVSEQYLPADTLGQISVHTFTPIMVTKSSKKAKAGETSFSFTNEHTVSSYRWGQNRFRFICGDFVTEFTLDQKK
jgi:hypothetical protein